MRPAGPNSPPDAPRSFGAFLVLWSTQTLSLFGTSMTLFAINIWLAVERYPGPGQKAALALALTATTVASTLPLIFGMPLAGAFADRHDRRRILLLANLASALLAALLVLLLVGQLLTLWNAVLLLALYALAGSFHNAAFDSTYATLVPEGQVGRANGMMQTSYALSQVLAPAAAATLIGLPALLRERHLPLEFPASLRSGVPFAFAADALTFAFAALAVALLRFPAPGQSGGPRVSVWHDVGEGFRWILRRRPLLWLISFGSLANFTFAPLMLLLPLLVRDRLAADRATHHLSFEAALALVNMAMGAGGVLGGVVMTLWGGVRRRTLHVIVGALAILGLGQLAAAFSTTVTFMALALFLAELVVPALNTHSFTLWQEITPTRMLGRALATRRFISQCAFPVGTMIAGWIAAGAEPWVLVAVSGSLLAGWCLWQARASGLRDARAAHAGQRRE